MEFKKLDYLYNEMNARALELARLLAADPTMDALTLDKLERFREAQAQYINAFAEWKKQRKQGSEQ